MRAQGNGNKYRCVENLLAIVRGEVPYDRLRGLNPRLIDRPAPEVRGQLVQDATWLVETYEPRVDVDGVNIQLTDGPSGGLRVNVDIAGEGETTNGGV